MKIAWFTPFCRTSGIGQYSAAVLDRLSAGHDVTVYATGLGWGSGLRPRLRTRAVRGPVPPAELDEFDVAVYNLGDHFGHHDAIHGTLLTHPGVAVLHDLSLWGLFLGRLGARTARQRERWLGAMEYSHGPDGRAWGLRFLAGGAAAEEGASRWTLARAAVHGSLGVVVHRQEWRDALAARVAMPVEHIDFPAPGPAEKYCSRLVALLEECRSCRPVADLADRLGHHVRALLGSAPAGLAERLGRALEALAAARPAGRARGEAA